MEDYHHEKEAGHDSKTLFSARHPGGNRNEDSRSQVAATDRGTKPDDTALEHIEAVARP